MEKKIVKQAYLETLAKRVLVFDGAMGTSLQALHLTAEDYGGKSHLGCNDALVLSAPEAVRNVHRSFLEAGADVIETNTFRSNHLTLAEFNLASQVLEMNKAAAEIARAEADRFSTTDWPRFVAGSIGPSGKLISSNDPVLSDIHFDELVALFREQACGLLQGGVDLLLIETASDLLELKAAVAGVHQAFEEKGFCVPIQAQVTLDVHGKTLMGSDIKAVLAVLEGLAVDVIGLNCSTGPEHMEESVAWLTAHSQKPISIIPNAGLPINVNGEAVYTLSPQDFAASLIKFVREYGVRVVGGCCGTRPEHIRALVDGLKNVQPKHLEAKSIPGLASVVSAVAIKQEPKPFIIGERLNAAGSRAFKRLLIARDYEGILQVAREQVAFGAHALDLNVAMAGDENEAQRMAEIVKKLALEISVPLVLDSIDLTAIEAGLQATPGRCLINSVNFEKGDEKVRKVFQLAKKYSAMVVCLTIDEKGMAITAERKLALARRFLALALDCGLCPGDLLIDSLTFTLASGDSLFNQAAKETLQAIKQIKQHLPELSHLLGVSNVSYGLGTEARCVLNSVFLHEAIQAGLDAAIINPAQIMSYQDIAEEVRALASDLIYYRRDDALDRFVAWFESHQSESHSKHRIADPLDGLNPAERLKKRVISRIKPGIEEDIQSMLEGLDEDQASKAALGMLNEVLLPAMQEVGDAFGKGDLILPFVLQSAEVMKLAVSVLESHLGKRQALSKGKIVLATVYGDIHDIGKNLVKTILENNGYTVIDLGKQVPVETIIQTAIEEKADAIGLSALLVATSKQMQLMVETLHDRKLEIPIVIGGAAINQAFGWRILRVRDDEWYSGGVFYCKDAFDGLAVMDALSEEKEKRKLLRDLQEAAKSSLKTDQKTNSAGSAYPRAQIPAAFSIPSPQYWGVRHVEMNIASILPYLDKNALYRVSWGARGVHGEEWEKLQKEYDARLERMLREAERDGWLKPEALLGYWPCQAADEELLVYAPGNKSEEPLVRFHFPRANQKGSRSLTDYFLEVGQKQKDIVGLQVVTVGPAATEKYGLLETQAAYSEGYYVHGLAVCMAEAVADHATMLMRKELGLVNNRGRRFSWGYPAAPDICEHFKLFRLLPAQEELGMNLTSAGQLVPEQSTAAIFVHHQAIRYSD